MSFTAVKDIFSLVKDVFSPLKKVSGKGLGIARNSPFLDRIIRFFPQFASSACPEISKICTEYGKCAGFPLLFCEKNLWENENFMRNYLFFCVNMQKSLTVFFSGMAGMPKSIWRFQKFYRVCEKVKKKSAIEDRMPGFHEISDLFRTFALVTIREA